MTIWALLYAMNLTLLKNKLKESGVIDAIREVCSDTTECYLVGGAIRDCVTNRQLNDFDFCFPENPTEYARRIADNLGATFFILDDERGHSRFVLKNGSGKLTCDFAPFRAPSLASDLRKRDFTINAMALSCLSGDFELIDPLHGYDDLTDKKLRACSEYSFQEDPLRCLKGIRHAVCMGLEFDPETLERLTDAAPQIDQVASERIRIELSRTVAGDNPVKAFELLNQTGLARELFGPASDDAFVTALAKLKDLDQVIRTLRSGACGRFINDYLIESIEEQVTITVALRMAAFFYGYRPVALRSVLSALRFSKRTVNLIEQLQKLDESTVASFGDVAVKPRSRARWLASIGSEPLSCAIFLLLVSPGTVQDNLLQCELLIDSFLACSVRGRLTELVDGTWFTDELGIAEGPEIGRLQALVHQAEISGDVTTPEEARQWLLEHHKSIDNDFEGNL